METGINLYEKLPYQEVISAFVENGIKNTFVGSEHPELRAAMKMLRENGIRMESFHAPFYGETNMSDLWYEGEAGEMMLRRLRNSVDMCCEYGVGTLVTHPSTGRPMPPINELGTERYREFFSYAWKKGIAVAMENHRFFENTEYLMKTFPKLDFCWDVGHEACFTQGIDYLSIWGDRLSVMHISDSECIFDTDKHLIPFDGKLDFEKIAEKISGLNCNCALMLELKPGNDERYKNLSTREYYKLASQRAKKLADMVDAIANRSDK